MPTLILTPRQTEDTRALKAAASRLGWDSVRLQGWRPPPGLRPEEPVVYGEPLFVAAVSQCLDLTPLEAPFDWLTTLQPRRLQRTLRFLPLSEARSLDFPSFLKPADDKCFPARVYQHPDELPPPGDLPPDTPTLASEPVHWTVEYRAFVRHGEILTLSPYCRDGEQARGPEGDWPAPDDECEEATAFLNELLQDTETLLPPGAVVDVGRIRDRGWAVIEANPCWGSGIYGCDPEAVCETLRAAIRLTSNVTDDDHPWIPHRGPS